MFSLVYNEIYKMIANRKLAIFLLITFGVLLLPAASLVVPELDMQFSGQDYAVNMLSGTVSMLLPIFIIIMFAEMFASEYEKGTLKNSLIQPVSRTEVLFSKLIAVMLISTVLLFASMICSYILGTVLFGWGEGIIVGEGRITGVEGIIVTIASHLISLVPLLAFALLVLVICVAASSGTTAIGVGVGAFFGMTFLGQLVEQVQPYLITTHFSLYIQVIEESMRSDVWISLLVLLVYAVLSYGLAIYLFKRKQIVL